MAHISALIKKLLPWSVVLLLALPGHATCVPDLINFTPTPVISWDPVPDLDLDGYIVYVADNAPSYTQLAVVPCDRWIDDDTGLPVKSCKTYYVPQRGLPTQLEFKTFCVRAYDESTNISLDCSNSLTICMPDIWDGPSEAYN